MTDPWAWLHQEHAPLVDVAQHQVSVILIADLAETLRPLIEAQSVEPLEIIECTDLNEGATRATGEWLWLFPQPVEPSPTALEELLRTAAESEQVGLVGPLMLHTPDGAEVIESCGLTTTVSGRVVAAVEGGDRDQGQLTTVPVLGVDACAGLVRATLWRDLDGMVGEMPAGLAGVELGRRMNSVGYQVIAEPSARVLRTGSSGTDPVEQRTWELRLAAAGATWWARARLALGSVLAALGFLLGKDAARAGAELRALRRWRSERDPAAVLEGRAADPETFRSLTKSRRELIGLSLDRAAGRIAEGWALLADRDTAVAGDDAGLDALTGDDFAARGRARRITPIAIAGYLLAIGVAMSGWRLLGTGRLSGAGLLPSQTTWTDLLHTWVDPVAGQLGAIGAPWLGTTAVAALATFGQVEWLVTGGFLAAVPLAWLLALRTLRRSGVDGTVAVMAAVAYALAPVVVGALGGGWLGLLTWAVLLPLLADALYRWATDRSWRSAGTVALWLALAVVEVPLGWPLVVLAMLGAPAAWSLRGAGQVLLVAPAGLIGLGQSALGWTQFPGRFLVSASPTLAPLEAPEPWLLALGRPVGVGVAPLWVSATLAGLVWLTGLLGLIRRPRAALPGFVAAGVGLALAVLVSRLVVTVPPGVEVRPQAQPWLIVMFGGLALAAARGLSGLDGHLRSRAHRVGTAAAGPDRVRWAWRISGIGSTSVAVAALAIAAGWWAWASTGDLSRTTADSLPPFVRAAMTSDTPVRTLAISRTPDQIDWAVLEGDLPRLGDDEGRLPATAEPDRSRAASVVARLLSGSADDQLAPDLARLGVGYVWVRGAEPELRAQIANVPGLGVATGDETAVTWPVPGAGIATVEGGDVIVTGDGRDLPVGGPYRRLVLAQPADPRWWASVGGRRLTPVVLDDSRQAFELGEHSGTLRFGLGTTQWAWPITQAAALLALIVLAAPRIRRRP